MAVRLAINPSRMRETGTIENMQAGQSREAELLMVVMHSTSPSPRLEEQHHVADPSAGGGWVWDGSSVNECTKGKSRGSAIRRSNYQCLTLCSYVARSRSTA